MAITVPTAPRAGLGQVAQQPLRAPQASPAAFGAGDDQSVTRVGAVGMGAAGVLDQATMRIAARESAVDRARQYSTFTEQASAEFRRIQTEGDLSDPATTQGYRAFLDDLKAKTLSAHRGDPDSQARLFERVEAARTIALDQAVSEGVAAQRRLVQSVLDQRIQSVAARAYDSPESLMEGFGALDAEIDDMAPALSPDEERVYRAGARSQLTLSAVTSLIDRGDLDGADSALATPEIAQYLDADSMRQLKQRTTVQRLEADRTARELQTRAASIESFLGRSLSGAEKAALVGLAPQTRASTTADKVREFEAVIGRPANEAEIAKMYGAQSADSNMFGGGIHGRALEMITELAPMYSAGMTSPTEERQLEAAMAALRTPDPITGMRVTEPPPFLELALAQRGVDARAAFDGQSTIVGVFPTGEDGMGEPAADPLALPAPAAAPAQTGEASAGTGDFFGRAGDITGPVPAAADMASRIPAVGALVPGQEMARARQEVTLAQRDLVRVLQNNPRFAEGERQAIEREVSIGPRLFDNPEAYRQRLIAIDDSLRRRLEQARTTAQSRQVSQEERAKSMDLVNAIEPFLQQLGVPPLVRTPEEARQLSPGTVFRNPQGQVLVVPSNGG